LWRCFVIFGRIFKYIQNQVCTSHRILQKESLEVIIFRQWVPVGHQNADLKQNLAHSSCPVHQSNLLDKIGKRNTLVCMASRERERERERERNLAQQKVQWDNSLSLWPQGCVIFVQNNTTPTESTLHPSDSKNAHKDSVACLQKENVHQN
jgi:hypothetical protein